MANLYKDFEKMNSSFVKKATITKMSNKELKDYLTYATKVARRVEAARTVNAFFGMGGGLTDIIDNVLSIATPLVAISGDFELSNLLGSLKVWLDKKKMQERLEEQQKNDMMNNSYQDFTFDYGF